MKSKDFLDFENNARTLNFKEDIERLIILDRSFGYDIVEERYGKPR